MPMRRTMLVIVIAANALLAHEAMAAAPMRAARRAACCRNVIPPAQRPAPPERDAESDLAARVAALERQMADLTRRQAQREADEAQRPRVYGHAWTGTGGSGVWFGIEGYGDDR